MVYTDATNDREIEDFLKVMLDKPTIEADRTWLYSLKRFFHYLSVHTNNISSFNVENINSYLEYLKEIGKSEKHIKKNAYVVFTFAQYQQHNITKESILLNPDEKMDISVIEEEDDIFHTEKTLYDRVKNTAQSLTLSRKPQISELQDASYSNLRVYWQDYLLFRLVLETGIDLNDLTAINIEDIYEDRIAREDRDIPLLKTTAKMLHQYIAFRKQFDKAIFTQTVMFHMGIKSNGISELFTDPDYSEFIKKELSEKIDLIESLLMDQVNIEERIQELEIVNDDTSNDEVEELEEKLDIIADQIGNMKAILVFERKINEYVFNNALFVTERYTKMDKSDILKSLLSESFPIHKLQNTCIEKWLSADIKSKQIEKILEKKGSIFTKTSPENDFEEYRQMISKSYTFHDSEFSIPL